MMGMTQWTPAGWEAQDGGYTGRGGRVAEGAAEDSALIFQPIEPGAPRGQLAHLA